MFTIYRCSQDIMMCNAMIRTVTQLYDVDKQTLILRSSQLRCNTRADELGHGHGYRVTTIGQ